MFNFKQELQSTITLFQKHLFITVFFYWTWNNIWLSKLAVENL